MRFSLSAPKEQLYELYVNQHISSVKLGELYGVSKTTILRALHDYGIPVSSVEKPTSVTKKVKWSTKFLSLYAYAQDEARSRGYSFDLTEEQFYQLISSDCHYCGNSPKKRLKFRSVIRNGIDRADNTQGYTIENSRPCCGICNLMKRAMSEEQFITHALQIATHQTKN